MYTIITVIHVLACLILVGVVLLQQGKGAEMGAVFGGSSSTVFGSSGAGNFLTRLTAGLAVVFMLTSLTLTYSAARRLGSTVFDSGALPEPPPLAAPVAPKMPQAQAQPPAPAPAAQPAPVAPAPKMPAASK